MRGLKFVNSHCFISSPTNKGKIKNLRAIYRLKIAKMLGLWVGFTYLIRSRETNLLELTKHLKSVFFPRY